jgi:hypothetical protein
VENWVFGHVKADFGCEKGVCERLGSAAFCDLVGFLVFWVGAGVLQTCIFVCFLLSGEVLPLYFLVDFLNIL